MNVAIATPAPLALLVLRADAPIPAWLDGVDGDGIRTLRIAPQRRLFVFDSTGRARGALAEWRRRLHGCTHLLTDATDRFVTLRLRGDAAAAALAAQTTAAIGERTRGIRTLLGDAPVIVDVRGADCIDVLVERCYAHYALEWIRQTVVTA